MSSMIYLSQTNTQETTGTSLGRLGKVIGLRIVRSEKQDFGCSLLKFPLFHVKTWKCLHILFLWYVQGVRRVLVHSC